MVAPAEELLARVTVVLHHTRSAQNVGGTARAMANMGLGRLVLAEPAAWDRSQAMRVATEGGTLLESASFSLRLDEVLDQSTLFLATSARRRRGIAHMGPEEAARALIAEARRGGAPTIVFGDERSGLPRWVIDRAHGVSTIKTSKATSSLNLAQAVLVHAYELRRCAEEAVRGVKEEERERWGLTPKGKPMAAADMARLRELSRSLLLQVGYLNPDQPDRILSELERLLVRAEPTEREGRLLLALVKQLEWATGQRS